MILQPIGTISVQFLPAVSRRQALFIALGLVQYQLVWVLLSPIALAAAWSCWRVGPRLTTRDWLFIDAKLFAATLLNLIYLLHSDFQSDGCLPWLVGVSHTVVRWLAKGEILAPVSGCLLVATFAIDPQREKIHTHLALQLEPSSLPPHTWWDWIDINTLWGSHHALFGVNFPGSFVGMSGFLVMRLGFVYRRVCCF